MGVASTLSIRWSVGVRFLECIKVRSYEIRLSAFGRSRGSAGLVKIVHVTQGNGD